MTRAIIAAALDVQLMPIEALRNQRAALSLNPVVASLLINAFGVLANPLWPIEIANS